MNPNLKRLRRSMMFLNCQKPALIKDPYIYAPDSIMLDLEDAVAENQKDSARFSLYHALKTIDYGETEVIVRDVCRRGEHGAGCREFSESDTDWDAFGRRDAFQRNLQDRQQVGRPCGKSRYGSRTLSRQPTTPVSEAPYVSISLKPMAASRSPVAGRSGAVELTMVMPRPVSPPAFPEAFWKSPSGPLISRWRRRSSRNMRTASSWSRCGAS